MYKNTFGPKPNCPLATSVEPSYNYGTIVIGGPCAIESPRQIETIFAAIAPEVTHFRGGVFRAGTYPGANWGWQWDLLKEYHAAAVAFGKPNIVDVLDFRDLDKIEPYADVFQIGTRQAQHYALLKELGKQSKPVILKRGTWEKLSETMGSLEYLLQGGNRNIIICERGSVTFLDHVRWDISFSLIAKMKQLTKFPVIVDASHGTGDRTLVEPLTMAGMAAGADGCLVECHYSPSESMSDAEQAVSLDEFKRIVRKAKAIQHIAKQPSDLEL